MSEELLPREMKLEWRKTDVAALLIALLVAATLCIGAIPADMMTPVNGMRARWILGVLVACFVGGVAVRLVSGGFTLKLDPHGFKLRSLSSTHRYEWRACSEFACVTKGGLGHSHTIIEFTGEHGAPKSIGRSYGLAWEELTRLLNRFRERALAEAISG